MSKLKFRKIKDIATVYSGTTPDTKNSENFSGEINWYTPAEISGNKLSYVFNSERKITEEARAKKNIPLLPKNTVLLTSRAPIGKVAIAGSKFCTNQGFKNIVCDEKEVLPQYLAYWLSTKKEFLNSLGRGATFKEISKKIVEDIEVPIPSIELQKRIVIIFDKINEILEKRQSQLTALDELTQSLFLGMFGDPIRNSFGWPFKNLQEVIEKGSSISYGIVQTGEDVDDGIPVIRPVDFKERILIEELKKTSPEISNAYSRTILKGNELLITVRANIGSVMLATPEMAGINVTRGITPIRLDESIINREFAMYLLKSIYMQRHLKKLSKGITLVQLNMSDLREIPIILPPLEDQLDFALKIKMVEKQRIILRRSLTEMLNLYNSLLQKAFKGELFQEQ